jgi:hypothetical protein
MRRINEVLKPKKKEPDVNVEGDDNDRRQPKQSSVEGTNVMRVVVAGLRCKVWKELALFLAPTAKVKQSVRIFCLKWYCLLKR